MNYNRYRWCVASSCTNTSVKTPEKLFIKVPDHIERRNVWLELAKRDPKSLSTKSRLYLCEDHFNLEQDMENYMEYKIMGSVKYVKMKVHTTPSRFFFHSERKCKLSPSTSQSTTFQDVENIKLVEEFIDPTPSSSKSGSDTDSEYEIGAPEPSTEKKLRSEIVHKKCVTTYSSEDFKPSETQSTDILIMNHEGSPLQIIVDIVIEHDNNQMEVDDENPTIDHVQKPREIIGVRMNKGPKTSAERGREFRARKQAKTAAQRMREYRERKKFTGLKAPKTSAERGREFRARKALLKQQSMQQQEPDAIVEIATEYIRSAGPQEDNQVPGPSEIRTIEKRAKSLEATGRWGEKKKSVSESSKKQAKTAAQRMREYRARKKLAKKILLKQQSDQNLDAIVSTSSSQVNQRAGPTTINSIFTELIRRATTVESHQVGEIDNPENKIKEEYMLIDIKEEGVQSDQKHVCAMDNKHEYIIPDRLSPEIREHNEIKIEIKEEILDS